MSPGFDSAAGLQPQGTWQPKATERELTVGMAYARTRHVLPALVSKLIGSNVEELSDGYFVSSQTLAEGWTRRIFVRVIGQGADSRISLRAETFPKGKRSARALIFIPFVVLLLAWTLAGIVHPLVYAALMLSALAYIFLWASRMDQQRRKRMTEDDQERDLLIHNVFREIAAVVDEQGAAANYRVAPFEVAPAQEEPTGDAFRLARRNEETTG